MYTISKYILQWIFTYADIQLTTTPIKDTDISITPKYFLMLLPSQCSPLPQQISLF